MIRLIKNYWENIEKQRKIPLTTVQILFEENGFSYGLKGDLLLGTQRKEQL